MPPKVGNVGKKEKSSAIKTRLDHLLVERGLAQTGEQARRMIMAGLVLVDGREASKPGISYSVQVGIEVKDRLPYVSRGGVKLEAALNAFSIDPQGMIAADIGASTGGFTDCLLQRGAKRVYAVDVGYGQLDWRLRNDPRVVSMERTNIRFLEILPDPIDLATVDVSFISLRLVVPAVLRLLAPCGLIVALIKPQFEAGRDQVGKGGVVRDAAVHRQVLQSILAWGGQQGLAALGLISSPIRGPAGNREFLIGWDKRMTRVPEEGETSKHYEGLVDAALQDLASVSIMEGPVNRPTP